MQKMKELLQLQQQDYTFLRHLLKRLEIKGVDFAEVTLHVGLGTFSPVEVEDLSKHKMDSEQDYYSSMYCRLINDA